MREPRVLVVDPDERYLHAVARSGARFSAIYLDAAGSWDLAVRPVPPNVRLMGVAEVFDIAGLADQHDVTFCNRVGQLARFDGSSTPRLLMLDSNEPELGWMGPPPSLLAWHSAEQRLSGGVMVYPDSMSAELWGTEGAVIPLALDPAEYDEHAWRGDLRAVLALVDDAESAILDALTGLRERGIPLVALGAPGLLPGSARARSWDELRALLSRYRVCIDAGGRGAIPFVHEGAMLGAPIISVPESSSTHLLGRTGRESAPSTLDELQATIESLLDNVEACARIGQAARTFVLEHRPIDDFDANWERLFRVAAAGPRVGLPPDGSAPLEELAPGELALIDRPATSVGGRYVLDVTNRGALVWPAFTLSPTGRIALGCHWQSPDGATVAWGVVVVPLPRHIEPGQTVPVGIVVPEPPSAGLYPRFDLISEQRSWLSVHGGPILDVVR
jgi:hypothetical protein